MSREVKYSLIIQLVFLIVLLSNNAFSQNQDVIGLDSEYCINSPVDTIYGVNPTTGTFPLVDKDG
ncbi:MAG: hypothetical protein KAR16_10335, partial [Bacteroidales bacterium]|nr:hypothetical protein [Bacteroidales bacterium]